MPLMPDHSSVNMFMLDASVLLLAALVGLLAFRRLGFGSVLGFLVAGLMVGPSVFGFIKDPKSLLAFSEIGIVLLLFIIGLELQPKRLWEARKQLLGLGLSQWLVSAALLSLVAMLLTSSLRNAILIGLTLALSSTAFALQLLTERNALSTGWGQSSFAILLLQDIVVVPMLLLISLLGGGAEALSWRPLAGIVFIVILLLSARYIMEPVFRAVAFSKSPEAFTGAALLLVLGIALLMDQANLSMALGGFVAGVLVADSDYRHELEVAIQPFKGLLMGLFFVTVGASIPVALMFNQIGLVCLLVVLLLAAKIAVLYVLGRWQKLSAGGALQMALILSQGGEFAFILLPDQVKYGLLDADAADLLTLVVSLSMLMTPILLFVFDRYGRSRERGKSKRAYDQLEAETAQVIIAGFGRFGQIIGRNLSIRRIPFIAMDSDPDQVELVKRYGNKVYYGDLSRLEMLRAAGASQARLLVIALAEVDTSLRLARLVRASFPDLKIYARARNREHAQRLLQLGCEIVVRETYASSLELARETLLASGLTESAAANTVRVFRQHDEKLLRDASEHVDNLDKRIEMTKITQQELAELFASDDAVSEEH
jgi:monovalent cation:proton antiporter-2 (CPA2) family protein